jgi:integrase
MLFLVRFRSANALSTRTRASATSSTMYMTRQYSSAKERESPLSKMKQMSLRDYYEQVYADKRSRRVSEATWSKERLYWKRILSHLGDYRLSELSGAIWDDYLDTLNSGNYKRLNQQAYRTLLRHAEHRGAVDRVHTFERIKGSSTPVREVKPFSVDEVRLLLDGAESPMFRALFATAIGQGLRPQEALDVRWQDVDWRGGMMHVRGTKTTAAAGAIPLTPFTVGELGLWWRQCSQPTTGVAFPSRKTGESLARFDRQLRKAAAEARVDVGRRVHPNMLRHTFATLAAYYGVPLPVAQHILRHSSPRMLLQVYTKAGRMGANFGLENFPL